MTQKPLLKKQQSIAGYLEILDGDEVELRRPETRIKMTPPIAIANGHSKNHHLDVINEKYHHDRPFSFPPNLRLTPSTPSSTADDDISTVKRDSFIRQSFNTIRKSLRFNKSHRKSAKVSVDDIDLEKRTNRMNSKDDNNNKKNLRLKNVQHANSFSDECVIKKKPMKHFRNSSLGSYFSFR